MELRKHDVMSPTVRAYEAGCLALAGVLVLANFVRLSGETRVLAWWLPVVLLVGALSADLVSGLVHWAADTWGRESLPLLGPRFLRPFRIHHTNPE